MEDKGDTFEDLFVKQFEYTNRGKRGKLTMDDLREILYKDLDMEEKVTTENFIKTLRDDGKDEIDVQLIKEQFFLDNQE